MSNLLNFTYYIYNEGTIISNYKIIANGYELLKCKIVVIVPVIQ